MIMRLLLRVVSCGSDKAVARGGESRKDIEHILNSALPTIVEEDEPEAGFADDFDMMKPTMRGEQSTVAPKHRKTTCCTGSRTTSNGASCGSFGRRLARHRVMTAGIASSYVHFMTAFASRGGLVGLSRF